MNVTQVYGPIIVQRPLSSACTLSRLALHEAAVGGGFDARELEDQIDIIVLIVLYSLPIPLLCVDVATSDTPLAHPRRGEGP